MSDIRQTLAQLDHRLEDLRRQVDRLVQDTGPASNPGLAPSVGPASNPGLAPPAGPAANPGPSSNHGHASGPRPPAVSRVPSEPAGRPEDLLAACERLLTEARALLGPRLAEAQLARPAFFEGTVTLVVLGAHRLQTIQVLEDSLSRARQVMRVYLRGAAAGQVRFELTLSGGVELIGELNRVMPFPFAVGSATASEIVLSLEGEGVDL